MTDHTPEPWLVDPEFNARTDSLSIRASRLVVAETKYLGGTKLARANAARIVACVNACAGIPTEQLLRCRVGHFKRLIKSFRRSVMNEDELTARKDALAPFRKD